MLSDGVSITGQDAAAYVGALAVILGGVWFLLDRVVSRPLDTKIENTKQELTARLKEQDHQIAEVKQLATDGKEEAATVRSELREHMRREEVAFAAPWWRRHKARL